MNELVSIVMPSYNTAKFISRSIESVIQQTYSNWELLIVDDCSTDQTDSVVKPFLKDNRIKYIKNKTNLGAAISRNVALKEARGKWIAFLDSDDLWYPDKLNKQISFMHQHNYHFSYTNYVEIDENDIENGIKVTGPKVVNNKLMKQYCYLGCLTVMYNADYIGLVQIENIKKNNDYALWLEISETVDCYLLDETLAKYRRRVGSISNHSILTLVKWHYQLWYDVRKYNVFWSLFYTFLNLVFGMLKKVNYVRRN